MLFMAATTVLLFVAASINVGYAIHDLIFGERRSKATGTIALALGFAAFAAIGVVIWLSPGFKGHLSAALLTAANLAAGIHNIRNGRLFLRCLRHDAFALLLWVAVSLALFVVAHLNIPRQENLYDGPYVYKHWTTPVKIQVIAGDFPADDVLPALVAEYMARGTSFKAVRPLAPGQEVTNRPFLQALLYLPIRVLSGPLTPAPSPYPTLNYVGTSWPDTTVLISDESYAFYLAVAIPLNASLLVAFASLLAVFRIPQVRLVLVAFCAVSPYFLLHSIFTWPKNLAAFYVVAAVLSLRARYPLPLAGFLFALAYWSHPYAAAFAFCFALLLGFKLVVSQYLPYFDPLPDRKVSFRDTVIALSVMAATIIPWLIWVNFIVRIPSDMLAQASADAPIRVLIWARINNFATLLFPTSLMLPEYNLERFAQVYLANLASAIGLIPVLFIPWIAVRYVTKWPLLIFWFGFLPGSMVVGVYDRSAMAPLLHGWQAVWPALLVAVLLAAARELGARAIILMALCQLILNLSVLTIRAHTIAIRPDSVLRYPVVWSNAAAPPRLGVTVRIGADTKVGLFSAAPTTVRFRVPGREGTNLKLWIGVHPETYRLADADETIFRIAARSLQSGQEWVLLDRRFNVRGNEQDRAWFPVDLKLPGDEGADLELSFECGAGAAGNTVGDWCIWGSPSISR